MGLTWASYYQFARVNSAGPETKNYAVTDLNWQTASLLLKRLEQHHHNASTPTHYPGFNINNTATPATPVLTLSPSGGSLQGGVTVGVRLSFVDQYGLETDASPETFIQTPSIVLRPNAPLAGSGAVATPVPGAISGGTFLYALTKRQGTGESTLSDVTTVTVPFNTTAQSSYTVPLTFDPINSYSDGTDSLCLYRTTGFDTNFVLLNTFTATPGKQNSLVAYTDDGTVKNLNQQPPQTSSFGKQNQLKIDWSNLPIPNTAYRFKVYLTQQSGVWGSQNLFQDYLLINPATPFPTNVVYNGIETLALGFPFDYNQIPFGAPLLDLSSEAIGAPRYTTSADAGGWQTYNFTFPTNIVHATPMFGSAYIDGSIGGNGQLKVCLATPNGPNNPGIFTTLAAVGSGYAHPLTESGGHTASHIYSAPTGIGGPTQDALNSIIATPVGPNNSQLYRKQVTNFYRITSTPTDLVQSNVGAWQAMGDLSTGIQYPNISPSYTGQWFQMEFQSFTELFAGTNAGNIITAVLLINGQQINETMCPMGGVHATPSGLIYGQLNFTYATPLTRPNNTFAVQWMLSQPGYALAYGGNVVGQAPRRMFVVNETF